MKTIRVGAAGTVLTLTLMLSSAVALAEDLTTLDGATYKNVTVTRYDAARITIRHDSGIGQIPIQNLPEEWRKRFGYNPQAAAAQIASERSAAAQSAQRAAIFKQLVAITKKSFGRIVQVTDKGLLMDVGSSGDQQLIFLVGHPKQPSLTDDKYIAFYYYPAGRYSYATVIGGTKTIEQWQFVSEGD